MTVGQPAVRKVAGLRWPVWMPAWASACGLALLLAGAWAVVYLAGGTHSALPHVFYIPIVVAVLPFGVSGGLVAAAVAMLLCGPLMPLDVASGVPQPTVNWAARGAFFLTVGGLAGAAVHALRNSYTAGLAERLRQDVTGTAHAEEQVALEVASRIAEVLAARAFHPVFQPIYALDDGRLVAVEALTRFDTEPSQPPDVWFEQATQAGLGPDLELAAIEAALAASIELPAGVALSVNSSPETLADPRLLELVDRHRGRPLIVEVTEHAVVDNYQLLDTARRQLRERGVNLAVDDAGAGFASLRHIVRLAPEFIKLDTSLTRDIRFDPVRQALASSLIQFAHQTRSQLIVEGVEQLNDLLTWRDLGAHAAQGYLLARPGPLPVPEMFEIDPRRPARRLALHRVSQPHRRLAGCQDLR